MNAPSRKGLYLVLEGGDGTGKSTQAAALAAALRAQGAAVTHLREPGSTPLGEALRRILLDPETGELQARSEVCMFSAARAEMLSREVQPALERGELVLVERCYLSTLAYQGYASAGVEPAFIRMLTAEIHKDCWPDLVFLLDVDEATRVQRAQDAGKADRFERRGEAFHARVRQGYLQAAEGDPRVRVVDASRPADAVTALLLEAVQQLREPSRG